MKYITISILLLFLFSAFASAQTTTIEITPPDITVESGHIFNITLYVSAEQLINTVATDLITYDKNVIECTNVQQGTLFPDTVIWIPARINNENGTLNNMVWGSQQGTTGSGAFCILTFRGKTGSTSIVIDPENYGVANAGVAVNRTILNSCTVTVSGGDGVDNTTPVLPMNITVPAWLYPVAFIIIIIVVIVILAVFYLKKRKKQPKEKKGEEAEQKDDDVFG
jgi:hypothetical protein